MPHFLNPRGCQSEKNVSPSPSAKTVPRRVSASESISYFDRGSYSVAVHSFAFLRGVLRIQGNLGPKTMGEGLNELCCGPVQAVAGCGSRSLRLRERYYENESFFALFRLGVDRVRGGPALAISCHHVQGNAAHRGRTAEEFSRSQTRHAGHCIGKKRFRFKRPFGAGISKVATSGRFDPRAKVSPTASNPSVCARTNAESAGRNRQIFRLALE